MNNIVDILQSDTVDAAIITAEAAYRHNKGTI
jgi:hypothetical protein